MADTPQPTTPPTDTKVTYEWQFFNPEKTTVFCSASYKDDQIEKTKFLEAETSTFHDEDLQQCTKEVNAIINKYKNLRKDEDLDLAFLKTSKGLFLAWTSHCVSADDDKETIFKTLGIKGD